MPSSTVQLFITCILDTLYPATGFSVAKILEYCGLNVTVPTGQTCCGQPAFNAGMRREAATMAKRVITLFESSEDDIIIPSGSCCSMIRKGYLELFHDDPIWLPRAERLAEHCFEFSEYLVDRLINHFPTGTGSQPVSYHASCHLLRELNIHAQPTGLIQHIHPAGFVEMDGYDECCGFGGVFSIDQPRISTEMVNRKIMNISNSGAEMVVACDAGCITNINGALHRAGKPPCMIHIADFLAHELGLEQEP